MVGNQNTLIDLLAQGAEDFGEAPALLAGSGELSYAECSRRVGAMAAALREEGMRARDRLGIALPTSVEYVILLMACFRSGMTACPANPSMPKQALAEALAAIGCCALVSEASAEVSSFSSLAISDLTANCDSTAELAAPIHVDQPAAAIFTSGSQGDPKAALLSYGNLYHNARASNRNIPVAPGDRWLLSLPLYHVSGLGVLFRCLLGGGAVAIPEPGEPIQEALMRHEATHVSLVPTQLRRLMGDQAGVFALRKLKAILLGGSPTPEPMIEQAFSYGLPLRTTYGLTEMASQVTTTRPAGSLDALKTSGHPLEADTVSISEEGEVLVRGRCLFLGYVRGESVERPLTQDGWFATGDLGGFDESGRLNVIGRKDNRFVSGGENVHPEEIERELRRIVGVADALVVPVTSKEFGHRPVAFVREARSQVDPRPASLPLAERCSKALAERLPGFKIPDAIWAWPEDLAGEGMKPNRPAFISRAQELLRQKAGGSPQL